VTRGERTILAVLVASALALSGCALLPRSDAPDGREPDVEVRPDAPPEYDVLVAQQHAGEGRMARALAAYERAVAKDPDSAYLHRILADALARSNRLEEALRHARRAHELDPDDAPTRDLLAQLYRVHGAAAAAEAVLRDESGDPLDAEAAFLLYQIQLEGDRPEAALEIAEWMLAHDAHTLRGHIAKANAYQRLGRPADAERALRAALAADPGNLRVYMALARARRESGDRAGEIAIYQEMLERHPDHHGTLLALAEAQMAEDDRDGAIATYEELERRFPGELSAQVRLGFLLFDAQQFEAAVEYFERVLRKSPEEHEIAFWLGIAQRRLNRDDEAHAAFASIPPDHQYFAEARTQLAVIHEESGEYEQALQEVRRALDVEPTRELEFYSATLRAKAGDFEGAVAYLEAMLREEPENDELHYNLGIVYGGSDRTDEAIRYMQRALELNPDNANALNYIGYTWAEQGVNLDEAEKMIVRAIELRPEDGYIVDSLGWVYYMRARPLVEAGQVAQARALIDRALSELERADELTGGDPVIAEHLGDTYLLLDERRRALDKFEEALHLGPREDEQPHLYKKLETLRREFE
jgi:tetratricopeptide (TPR) repeat protein